MQLTAHQQYLVRPSRDIVYYFFLRNDKSLNYNTYDKNNVLLDSTKLFSNIIDFSVAIGKNEEIHLICITSGGKLKHYINKNNNWSYKVVSRPDVKSNVYKYLTIYVDGEYTHAFYTKTNLLTQALSTIEHIYWNGKDINKVIVSNYIHGKYISPFRISSDNMGNFHMVYKVFYKDNHQLYYNRFKTLTKTWTSNEPVTDLQNEHSHPYIFIDRERNLHLVWCTIEQGNFVLKYKKRHDIIDTTSNWSNTQTLSNKNSNCISPILIQRLNSLVIYYKRNDKIIEIVSKDFGDSWTYPTNNRSYSIKKPEIIQYSNNPQADDRYLAEHVYGNIGDTIEIIGVDLFNNKNQNSPPTQLNSNLGPDFSAIDQTNKKTPLAKDMVDENIISEDIDEKINAVLLQIAEYKSERKNEQKNNDETIGPDKLNDTVSKIEESNSIMNELLYDYSTLEDQLFEIKEESRELARVISDYEINLNLLEEKMVDYKKQMLIFQEKLSSITPNGGMFQRFINLFK